MSHMVKIQTQIRDLEAVKAACKKLFLHQPVQGKAQVYQKEMEGVLVQLPNWQFPIVLDLGSGAVHYDNYNGHWGDTRELKRFTQRYAVEKSIMEAQRQGYSVTEETLDNGAIRLLVNAGEG